MFVGTYATRFVTARGRMDVGGGARIGTVREMSPSGRADSKLELKQVLDLLNSGFVQILRKEIP